MPDDIPKNYALNCLNRENALVFGDTSTGNSNELFRGNCMNYLSVELVVANVSLDEVIQRPLDTVEAVFQLPGRTVRVSVLNHTPCQ